ncbi:MAG: NTP transferase domain-containing protein [Staphylothermus sp.]|nr:NTP transferase domain-containing protein [Staphylothermus sp.]
MKAIILAAGKGIRLRPITETRPKPLIPILCKPLLEWQLDALSNIEDIDEVLIVISYLKEKVMEYIENIKHKYGFKIRFVEQYPELGTGDAVIKAISYTDLDDDALIIYGDIFLENWDILREISKIEGNVILGVEKDNPKDYGVLVIEGNYLQGIIEKPLNPPSNLINAGIYKIRIKDIEESKDIPFSPRGEKEFTDILSNIVRNNKMIRVIQFDGSKWIDIGKPWHILEANKMALNKIETRINGHIEPNVSIKGKIIIARNAYVRSGTYIEGPAYIGENTEIGPSARIRPYSTICNGSKIGFSVEVKESLIMENVRISHLSYVGDSIICEHVNFGAGTIIANLRFDNKPVKMYIKNQLVSTGRRKFGAVVGAHVKTGINVSLMPGVKIGSYSWIAPGAIVYRDVPARSFYKWFGIGYIEDLPQE